MANEKLLALGMLLILALSAPCVLAASYTVPGDYPTIGAALETAVSGDVIDVQPGVYYESNLILRSGIQLRGAGDTPEETVIDAQGDGSILRCFSPGPASLVYNLTLKNGWAKGETSYDQSGGAIYINQAEVGIVECVFIDNTAAAHGGAIRCIQASPGIVDCTFRNNSALTGGGGAIDCSYNAAPLIRECTFEQNLAAWGGALACRGESGPDVVGCVFGANRTGGETAFGGAALAFFDSAPEFEICTFADNRSGRGGALAALPDSPVRLTHCTFVGNEADEGAGVYSEDAAVAIRATIAVFQIGTGITAVGESLPTVTCSNFHGNSSGDFAGLPEGTADASGNISADPLFCETADGEGQSFNLQTDSPCVTGDEACGTMGAWEADCTGDRGIQPIAQMPRVLTIENLRAAPNPFNPATRIYFELESEQRVRAEIYSLDGRRVHVLADQVFTPGRNELEWRGVDDSGRLAGSGLYIIRLQGEAETQTHKITLLK